jgi:hypothetical protein|tara:strand:- start:644 stop:1150 length:507 start_codon:yes stop_codon:yes gene_type:complete
MASAPPSPGVYAFLRSRDALTAVLDRLPFAEAIRTSAVCSEWQAVVHANLAELTSLNLQQQRDLTDAQLGVLASRCPRVCEVNLSGSRCIGDDGLATLVQCTLLRSLNISCLPNVTSDGVERATRPFGEQLVSLELGGCTALDADLATRFSRWVEIDSDEDGLFKVQG